MISQSLLENVLDLVDDRSTRALLDSADSTCGELIMHLVPDIITVTKLTCLLKALLREKVSIRNFDLVIQTVAEYPELVDKPRDLLSVVRIALSKQITKLYAPDATIAAHTLAPEIDFDFFRAEKEGSEFDPENLNLILKVIQEGKARILLCSAGARNLLRDCLVQYNLGVDVLAYEEITDSTKINSVSYVEYPNTGVANA